jgi:5-methylcytosine-specific restriction endonuclease McrA
MKNKTNRPKFNEETKQKVFDKTNGCCHLCNKKLVFSNYGLRSSGKRGKWEVDHSVPVAKGGSNHLNNYLPACISCNRSKGTSSTKAIRNKNGLDKAPLSKKEVEVNKTRSAMLKVGLFGGVLGLLTRALS